MDQEEYVMVNGRKTVFIYSQNKIKIPRRMYNGTKINTGVQLHLHYAYGLNQKASSYLFKEESLAYLAGQYIVMYDISKKKQTFINRSDEDEVELVTYCINYKEVLSIGIGLKNNAKNYATVRVYKTNRKTPFTLQHQHLAFGVQIKALQFIDNGKYCISLCQSIQNSFFISIFKTNKETLVTYLDTRDHYINLFAFISQNENFYAYGPKFLRIFNVNVLAKTMEDQPVEQQDTILSVAQLSQNFITLDQGESLHFYRKNRIVCSFKFQEFENKPNIISAYSAGVIVGFVDNPIIAVVEVYNNSLEYKKQYKLNILSFSHILSMHVGPDDSYITINAQHLAREENALNMETYLFNFGIVDIINTALRDPFEQLYTHGVHKGKILNIELSPCKSILTTISEDKQFKLWEFSYTRGEFKCLYSMQLHEIPLCMALHPMAFQCAIGYRDGLKFYFVLQDDLKQVFYENLKQCTQLKYSPGGNTIAVGTLSQIQLYNPYTYQVIQVITGHSGQITSLEWNDKILISSCSQGLVLCHNNQRIIDHSFKTHKAFCATYDPEYDLLIGSYSDNKVRIFNDKALNLYHEIDTYPFNYVTVQIFKLLDIIVFGTSCGKIRVYLWPFTNFNQEQDFYQIQVHQGPISQIKLSPDLSYMISGGEDGTVSIIKVKEFLDGKEITVAELMSKDADKLSLSNLYNFNSLAFVSRNSQDFKKDQSKELDFKIANLKSDIEDQKQDLIQKYNKKRAEVDQHNQQKIADQKELLSKIMEDADTRYKQQENQLFNMRKQHGINSNEIQQSTENKLLTLYQENDKLKFERKDLLSKNDEELIRMKSNFQNLLKDIENDFNQKLNDLIDRFNKSNGSLLLDESKFREVFHQAEKEHELLINQQKKKKMDKLQELTEKSEKIRSSNTKYQKECERFLARKMDLEGLIKETEQQISHLDRERENFKQANKEMKNQLKDKEKLIFQKEKEIKNYRNKNGHLQNFKNVNSFKLGQLQEEKAPLNQHTGELDTNIRVMYEELTDEATADKNLDQHIEDTKKQIFQAKQKLSQNREKIFSDRAHCLSIQNEIFQSLDKPDIDNFRVYLSDIHKKFFVDSKSKGQEDQALILQQEMEKNTQNAIREELLRQRDFLSKKINTVTRVSKQNDDDKNNLIIKVQNENNQLIKSCNELRQQRQGLKSHLVNMEKALDIISKEINLADGHQLTEKSEDNHLVITLQPEKLKKSRQSQPKLTGFQQYHKERDMEKMTKSTKNLFIERPTKTDLNQLLKEIKIFHTTDQDLKDQVQQFLSNDNSSSILPQIFKYPANSSQEETQIAALESSIATYGHNTSIEQLHLPIIKQ